MATTLQDYWNQYTTPEQGGAMSGMVVNPDGTVTYSLGGKTFTKSPQDFNAQVKTFGTYLNQVTGGKTPLYSGAYLPTDVAGAKYGGSEGAWVAPTAAKSFVEANAPKRAIQGVQTQPVFQGFDTGSTPKASLSSTSPTIGGMGPMATPDLPYNANPDQYYWKDYAPGRNPGAPSFVGPGGYYFAGGSDLAGNYNASGYPTGSYIPYMAGGSASGGGGGTEPTASTADRTGGTIVLNPSDIPAGGRVDVPGIGGVIHGDPRDRTGQTPPNVVSRPRYGTNDLGMPEGTNLSTRAGKVISLAANLAPYAAGYLAGGGGNSGENTSVSGLYSSTYKPGSLIEAAMANQTQPKSWLQPGVGYGEASMGHPQYWNEAGRPYHEGEDTTSYWYNPADRTWYAGQIPSEKITPTTNLPWATQPYVSPTGSMAYTYFNSQGKPYGPNDKDAWWFNSVDQKWYHGTPDGKVTTAPKPPWM